MYMLSADKAHATIEIRPFKGHLNSNYIRKIEEGQIIQFNRYHVASRQKILEELGNKIKAQWISETQELISRYKGLKVQLK